MISRFEAMVPPVAGGAAFGFWLGVAVLLFSLGACGTAAFHVARRSVRNRRVGRELARVHEAAYRERNLAGTVSPNGRPSAL